MARNVRRRIALPVTLRIRDRFIVLVALPLAVLAALIAVLAFIQVQTSHATILAEQSDTILMHAGDEYLALLDAETSTRGFLLTNDASFLIPYENALVTYHWAASELIDQTRDFPDQHQRAILMAQLAAKKIQACTVALDLQQTGKHDAAVAWVKSPANKQIMDTFRATRDAFVNDQRAMRILRFTDVRNLLHVVDVTLAVAVPIALLVTLIVAWLLSRDFVQRLSLLQQNVQRVAAGEATLDAAGASDELAALDRSFREMAQELKRREELVRMALEHAMEASRAKSDFLATMSHELRTPLNAIAGMTELLAETNLDAQQREYANAVGHSGVALLRIVNDLLDFARIEAGKLVLEERTFNLAECVRSQVRMVSAEAAAKHLDLAVRLDPLLPAEVRGDPGRVGQVLLNLLANAVKFTDAGGVVVTAVPELIDERMQVVRFSVSDSGIGIAEDIVPDLFNPFVQADSSPTRIHDGTGLGLSICKKLVDLMGGILGVTSEVGQGSTFWFTVPFEVVAKSAVVTAVASPLPRLSGSGAHPARAAQKDAEVRSVRAERILVVEDNPVNQRLAIKQLERLGFKASAVSNGHEAISAALHVTYDLVLMDCQMPEMDGYEATAEIRRREQRDGGHVTIVAMTANALAEDRAACLEAGMDDYLPKPVSLTDLRGVIERWIGPPAGTTV